MKTFEKVESTFKQRCPCTFIFWVYISHSIRENGKKKLGGYDMKQDENEMYSRNENDENREQVGQSKLDSLADAFVISYFENANLNDNF